MLADIEEHPHTSKVRIPRITAVPELRVVAAAPNNQGNIEMERVSDYNVYGSLLGLGENILLEILSEMEIPQDVQQFLVLCRKTYKLLIHPRYARIIQSIIEIRPIFIIKEQKQGRSDQNKFIHSDNDDFCTIAMNPVIREGIVKIEVIFENTDGWSRMIGIADASCSFAAGKGPWEDGNRQKTVRYYLGGYIRHITDDAIRNQEYSDGQIIGIEVDMTTVPRKVTFFVDEVEQPNFVIGIPEAVRFWAYTFHKSSSFTVIKFERLIKSTSQGVYGSKGLQWGKEWK
ncbi:MAG: hypothetical protein EZS28_026769 [Streblomastix strix]|uniref:B30.2/SPRY domain-containing protein n=2 Tax=Streblomastix strix TaxID=222440 RepID=A0A5J4V5Q8_9EUKA|nr:MAG: hypothetical protein EZS28_026769 [Streblomastix strix]